MLAAGCPDRRPRRPRVCAPTRSRGWRSGTAASSGGPPADCLLEVSGGHAVAVSLVCERLTTGTITAIDRLPKTIEMATRSNREPVDTGGAVLEAIALEDTDLGDPRPRGRTRLSTYAGRDDRRISVPRDRARTRQKLARKTARRLTGFQATNSRPTHQARSSCKCAWSAQPKSAPDRIRTCAFGSVDRCSTAERASSRVAALLGFARCDSNLSELCPRRTGRRAYAPKARVEAA